MPRATPTPSIMRRSDRGGSERKEIVDLTNYIENYLTSANFIKTYGLVPTLLGPPPGLHNSQIHIDGKRPRRLAAGSSVPTPNSQEEL